MWTPKLLRGGNMANLYDVALARIEEAKTQLGDEGWTIAALSVGALLGFTAGTIATMYFLGKLKALI